MKECSHVIHRTTNGMIKLSRVRGQTGYTVNDKVTMLANKLHETFWNLLYHV